MNLLLELVLVRKVPLLRGFHFYCCSSQTQGDNKSV